MNVFLRERIIAYNRKLKENHERSLKLLEIEKLLAEEKDGLPFSSLPDFLTKLRNILKDESKGF